MSRPMPHWFALLTAPTACRGPGPPTGNTTFRTAVVGEDLYVAYQIGLSPSPAVDPQLRRNLAGTWDAANTALANPPYLEGDTRLLGGASGIVQIVYQNGSVTRLE